MILIPWSNSAFTVPFEDYIPVNYLVPVYPEPLSPATIKTLIEEDLAKLTGQIRQASRIVLILEDPSRPSDTRDLTKTILNGIWKIRGNWSGFHLVVATGAHYRIAPRHLLKKVPHFSLPVIIHDSQAQSGLTPIGTSRSGIPLLFNETVVRAGLRLSVSTVNVHPLAGFSGGGKILLPGVAGLKTIQGLHGLPPGKPGVHHSAMRELMDEVLKLLPLDYSWHMISRPDGPLVKIYSGPPSRSHAQAKQALLNLVSCPRPTKMPPLLLLGCQPFDQNLMGIFKSLHQIPLLLAPGGRAILFNEAAQGTGSHHWRNDPAVQSAQINHYRKLLQDFQVAVYSPNTTLTQFQKLFPSEFSLINSVDYLTELLASTHADSVTVLPYAPITLISGIDGWN